LFHGPDETLPSVDFEKAKQYRNDETVTVEIMDVRDDTERTFE